jgi:hypothetical protein
MRGMTAEPTARLALIKQVSTAAHFTR